MLHNRALAAVLVLALGLASLGGLGGCQEQRVPNVVGMTGADAVRALQKDGYLLGSTKQVITNSVNPGTVVAQDPAAGARLKSGRTVNLSVASALNEIVVPSVIGKSADEASSAIVAASLQPTSVLQYSTSVPSGEVIAQLPEPGAKVVPGTSVGYTVSKGKTPTTVKVPNITGKSQSDAASALSNAGLVGRPQNAYSDTVAKGVVIIQSPGAGSNVSPGASVSYGVSLGKPASAVTVPSVVGKTESAATSAIKSAGLVASVTKASDPKVASGIVVSQMPPANSKTAPGGVVGIVVSTGPAPSSAPSGIKVPSIVGKSQADAEAALEAVGLVPLPVNQPSSSVTQGNVIEQIPVGGSVVPAGSTVIFSVSEPAPQ